MNEVLDNLIVVFILVALFVLGYCSIRKKSLTDVWEEVRDMFVEKYEVVNIK